MATCAMLGGGKRGVLAAGWPAQCYIYLDSDLESISRIDIWNRYLESISISISILTCAAIEQPAALRGAVKPPSSEA